MERPSELSTIIIPRLKVVHYFFYSEDHIVDVFVSHSMKHRQANEPTGRGFRNRKLATPVAESATVIRVKVNWYVMHIYA